MKEGNKNKPETLEEVGGCGQDGQGRLGTVIYGGGKNQGEKENEGKWNFQLETFRVSGSQKQNKIQAGAHEKDLRED